MRVVYLFTCLLVYLDDQFVLLVVDRHTEHSEDLQSVAVADVLVAQLQDRVLQEARHRTLAFLHPAGRRRHWARRQRGAHGAAAPARLGIAVAPAAATTRISQILAINLFCLKFLKQTTFYLH